MASVNTKTSKSTLVPRTHGGAVAKRVDAEDQLRRSVMSCLLWEKEFYEEGGEISARIAELIPKVDPKTVVAIAKEARSSMNLRHVPLYIVRIMASLPTHKHLVADTLFDVIQRADELTEFLSIYWKNGKVPLSKQVVRGLGRAFAKFDEFSLAKYNTPGKTVKFRDVLRICRPKPTSQEQSALWKRVVKGELATPDTWETELSKSKDKKASWTRLLGEKKLGALAFLRNLRNMNDAKVDHALIKAYSITVDVSRVLPFRFIAAAKFAPWMEAELENMMFRSLSQVPKLKGKTVLIVDCSGSMGYALSAKSDMTRKESALALAMIAREICEDVRIYATAGNDWAMTHATSLVPSRRGFALADAIRAKTSEIGDGGIFLKQVMDYTHEKETEADRVIVFTDEQDCDRKCNPATAVTYGTRNYIINIASAKNGIGYGKWTHFDGFSEAIINYISKSEED